MKNIDKIIIGILLFTLIFIYVNIVQNEQKENKEKIIEKIKLCNDINGTYKGYAKGRGNGYTICIINNKEVRIP